jgi:hypothetical protein
VEFASSRLSTVDSRLSTVDYLGTGFSHAGWGMSQKVGFQRLPMRLQLALRLVEMQLFQPFYSALLILLEVAIVSGLGDLADAPDLLWRETLTEQVERLHLQLYQRVRVLKTLGAEHRDIFVRKGQIEQGRNSGMVLDTLGILPLHFGKSHYLPLGV